VDAAPVVPSKTLEQAGAELGRAFDQFWGALAAQYLPAMQTIARQMDDLVIRTARTMAAFGRRLRPYRAAVDDYRRLDAALTFGLPPGDRADGGRLLLGLDD
jgi:hypothetical protein